MNFHKSNLKDLILRPILACVVGLVIGGLLTLLTGNSPLTALHILFKAGFSCQGRGNCAILTTLQYATPLIFSGLSAAVAFRAGIFSIGQAGQMLLGAAGANWIAAMGGLRAPWHPFLALSLAAVFGSAYALFPAIMKIYLGINEILSTILLNSIAYYLAGLIPSGFGSWIPESARLTQLARGTKLNNGLFLALTISGLLTLFLWRTALGYEVRMSGQNRTFSRGGGIRPARMVIVAMLLSGALAGLAGGVEVLGVHYHFVQNFSGSDVFDGVMVALIGLCHPLGILFSSFLLAGVRLAAMTGLSIHLGIPRSIGGMMISVMVIVMGADQFFTSLSHTAKKGLRLLTQHITNNRTGSHQSGREN